MKITVLLLAFSITSVVGLGNKNKDSFVKWWCVNVCAECVQETRGIFVDKKDDYFDKDVLWCELKCWMCNKERPTTTEKSTETTTVGTTEETTHESADTTTATEIISTVTIPPPTTPIISA